jgi:hypothetical protein
MAATWRTLAAPGQVLPGFLHHRLALLAGAQPRNRAGPGQQPPPGHLCGNRCAARHDAFLLEDPRYMNMVRAYYQVWNEIGGKA